MQLANQAIVTMTGNIPHLAMKVEGMKNYVDFDVIEVVNGGSSYPALLGIGWVNDSLVVINFKKHVMTFENCDIRFMDPMDPNEGRRYVEPFKE